MDGQSSSPLFEDTRHEITRNHQTLSLRVAEIDGDAGRGHLLVFGDPKPDDSCLVRIHSRCLYGEMLRSNDCDCGPELDTSLDLIGEAGAGVLIYLDQEGRGLGLRAKAHGYRHSQTHRVDTFTAYEALGYPADARTYSHAVDALREMGLVKVRLLTNNPDKVAAVRDGGIAVAVEHLHISGLDQRVRDYLQAKRRHRRHMVPRARVLIDMTSLASLVLILAFTATEHRSASMVAVAAAALTTTMRLRDATRAIPLREIPAGITALAMAAKIRASMSVHFLAMVDRVERVDAPGAADGSREVSSRFPEASRPDSISEDGRPQLDFGAARKRLQRKAESRDDRRAESPEGGPDEPEAAVLFRRIIRRRNGIPGYRTVR